MKATSRIAIAWCLTLVVSAFDAPGQATKPETLPATTEQTQWGDPKVGLQVSLSLEGEVAVGGKLTFGLALRGVGSEPVKLGAVKDVSCWLLVGQDSSDGKKEFYTEKVSVWLDRGDWPTELGGGKTVAFRPFDLSQGGVYSSEVARELLMIYVSGKTPDSPPKPVGKLGEVLLPGRAVAKAYLCLPRPGEKPLVVISNRLLIPVAPPPLNSLSAEHRKAFVAALLKQFDRDEFGGQAAHRLSVQIGKDVVPDLVKAVTDRTRPGYSRMWMATAIADIPDPKAAEALVGLLEDSHGGVRQVVAYHGPKQKSDKLDKAILEKAKTVKEDRFTAMALLGFMVFRNSVPEELVKAGLDSDDPRARATAAKVLGDMASDLNVARLKEMLNDKDAHVRSAAKKVLDAMKKDANP